MGNKLYYLFPIRYQQLKSLQNVCAEMDAERYFITEKPIGCQIALEDVHVITFIGNYLFPF